MDKVRRRIAREKPDVLEIHSPYVAAMAALSVPRRDYGVRTFQWHADFIDTYLRPILQKSRAASLTDPLLDPLWRWVRTIGKNVDVTLVAARWQEEKLLAHGVPRIARVPFGIDKERFRPERRSESMRRELLGDAGNAKDGTPLLVGVGRFATEKRWDVVLRAYLELTRTRPARLVLFGDGPERAAMEAIVAGRSDVRFAGFEKSRERLAAALASADVLVHGCPYETYGLSIAEGLASGLPAVTPDEGGAGEMIEAGGGIRYRAFDAEDCARAIAKLLAVKEPERRHQASMAAERVPTVEESVDSTVRVYERLLAERGERRR